VSRAESSRFCGNETSAKSATAHSEGSFLHVQNCRYERYCSAFGDVDAAFGSLGSFFSPHFAPTRGCFEANPPFVPVLMQRMAEKMESLLEAASAGLTFIVIVPAWTQLAFWKSLDESRWRRAPVLLVPAADHGYCDGAQHQRKPAERHRPSSFDTGVFVLQNDAAHARTTASSPGRLAGVLEKVRQEMAKAKVPDLATYEQGHKAKHGKA
jgi:phosphorylated CTD-interacting factor 1